MSLIIGLSIGTIIVLFILQWFIGQCAERHMRGECMVFHKWPKEWRRHPHRGNQVTRSCVKCGHIEDKRLF